MSAAPAGGRAGTDPGRDAASAAAPLADGPPASWLRPRWHTPGVGALMTSREGGIGQPPFDRFNLSRATGDDPQAVAHHQALLGRWVPARPVWLHQVHGREVVRLGPAEAAAGAAPRPADASVTTEPGVACAVMVADCLPVLMVAGGRARRPAVAAAHAGWRGLAAGVLEATLAALCEAAGAAPGDLEAWLGPCIGPRAFEVGDDVRAAFGGGRPGRAAARFTPRGPEHPGKWLADLPGLAHDRLRAAGVGRLQSAARCTVEERSRYFSYRRDGRTGRMAALVWIGEPIR